MAIGKVGAYATVQAPNVDFGEVALNAQKFQDADLEKKKVVKPTLKEGKSAEVYVSNTGIGSYDVAANKFLIDSTAEIQLLNNKAANQGLTVEETARQSKLLVGAKGINELSTSLAASVKANSESMKTMSKISTKHTELYKQALSGQAIAGFTIDESGDLTATFYETEKDPINNKLKYVLGDDGKPKILSTKDDTGNLTPVTISARNVALGDFKAGIIQPTDVNALTKTIVDGTGYNTFGTDTGVTKNVNRYVTVDNLATIKTNIKENLLKNNNSTLDILSRMAEDFNYKDKLKDYDYTGLRKVTEDELNLATEYVNKLVVSKLDTSKIKDVTLREPKGGDGDKDKLTPAITSITDINVFGQMKPDQKDPTNVYKNYAINAKSNLLSNFKYEVPTFNIYGAKNEVADVATKVTFTDLLYDAEGRPVLRGTYEDIKSTLSKLEGEDKTDFQKLINEFNNKNTPSDRKEEVWSKMEEVSQSTGVERKEITQPVGPKILNNLIGLLKGKTINGVKVVDESSLKRAIGYKGGAVQAGVGSKYNKKTK